MSTQYIQRSNYEVTELEEECLVLNTDNYTVTTLNELGGYCYSLLSVVQSVDSMVNAIKNKFNLASSEDLIRQDVEDFLENLMECGLIDYVDE